MLSYGLLSARWRQLQSFEYVLNLGADVIILFAHNKKYLQNKCFAFLVIRKLSVFCTSNSPLNLSKTFFNYSMKKTILLSCNKF